MNEQALREQKRALIAGLDPNCEPPSGDQKTWYHKKSHFEDIGSGPPDYYKYEGLLWDVMAHVNSEHFDGEIGFPFYLNGLWHVAYRLCKGEMTLEKDTRMKVLDAPSAVDAAMDALARIAEHHNAAREEEGPPTEGLEIDPSLFRFDFPGERDNPGKVLLLTAEGLTEAFVNGPDLWWVPKTILNIRREDAVCWIRQEDLESIMAHAAKTRAGEAPRTRYGGTVVAKARLGEDGFPKEPFEIDRTRPNLEEMIVQPAHPKDTARTLIDTELCVSRTDAKALAADYLQMCSDRS